jgi:hypothetical protein
VKSAQDRGSGLVRARIVVLLKISLEF